MWAVFIIIDIDVPIHTSTGSTHLGPTLLRGIHGYKNKVIDLGPTYWRSWGNLMKNRFWIQVQRVMRI
jgi:hypothetical protein